MQPRLLLRVGSYFKTRLDHSAVAVHALAKNFLGAATHRALNSGKAFRLPELLDELAKASNRFPGFSMNQHAAVNIQRHAGAIR